MMSRPREEMVAALVGSELSSVVFIRDYVQFAFEPATAGDPEPGVLRRPTTGVFAGLSAYTMPTVVVRGSQVATGELGYADLLVAQIGRQVRAAVETPSSLSIELEGGAVIAISFARSDMVDGQVEWAMLTIDDDSKSWTVWN